MEISSYDETVVTDDFNLEYVQTEYTFLKLMNKRTDQEFPTPDFLLNNTIQSCYIFINWNDKEVTVTLSCKYDKESYRIKPSFTNVQIFCENNQISSDFKLQPLNNFQGHCKTINNLEFYDYIQLKFEFHIKHVTYNSECIFPKKSDLYARLKNMYKEKKFADLRIFVKNIEFLAHKAIVGRYSKFAELFENSKEENNVKIIDIKDLDPALFEILLNYLYVGETEKIDFTKGKLTLLFNLIQVADKYDIDDLKTKLIEKTIAHLNKDNVVDILLFAHNCDLKLLKSRCICYITIYRAQICETVLFKDMVFNHPKLTAELLYFALQSIGE